jgi:hypothetical protein
MRKLSLASAVLLMYATLSLAAGPAVQGSQLAIGSVGFFHPWIGDRYADPDYKVKLNAADYQLGKLEYAGATWEKLKSFNVLILQWAPNEGDTSANAIYDQKLPLFERFVREGGGLLVTCENAYGTYRAVSRETSPPTAISRVSSVLPPGPAAQHAARLRRDAYLTSCPTASYGRRTRRGRRGYAADLGGIICWEALDEWDRSVWYVNRSAAGPGLRGRWGGASGGGRVRRRT